MISALVSVDGRIETLWAFEHKVGLWLTAEWLPAPREGWLRPARIVSLANLVHYKTPDGPTDIVVASPVPKSVLFGPDQRVGAVQYIVAENPDIQFPRDEIFR
jgi:hypothetical protein